MDKIKEFKPMLCPICSEFYFSEPYKEFYNEEIQEYLNGEVICPHCGWIYELEQLENLNTYIGYNKKTLNEYKKWYKEKIRLNPYYDYLEDNTSDPIPHMCPICGKYEFEDENSFDICPSCGWEDDAVQNDDPDFFGGANKLSLNEYKKQYQEKIKENPNYFWGNDYAKDNSEDKNDLIDNDDIYGNKDNFFTYSDNDGVPTKHISYMYAKDFDEDLLELYFYKYGKEFNCSNKEEYEQKAITFVNDIDRDNYKSFVDYNWITYKFDPRNKTLVVVTKDGNIISFKHYDKTFYYEIKKGKRKWII